MLFKELFLVNFKMVYRNKQGFFWTIIMPVALYAALSVLPIGRVLGNINYSNYLLPGMLALVIMQGGIYTLAYWSVDLKGRGVIKRLQVTPVKKSQIILSLVMARTVLVLAQVLVLCLIGMLFFGIIIKGNLLLVAVFAILGAFLFLPMGLLISTFADTYEAAAPFTAAIGMPMTFLGNVFYPTNILPQFLRQIADFLPMTYLAEGFRLVFLNPENTQRIMTDIVLLLIWIVLVMSMAIARFKLEE